MADQPSTLFLMFRLGLSLGLVLALVGGITWVLRRRGLLSGALGGKSTGRLQILDRKSLNKHASLVVARVGDTSVLLGVTDQNVTVLSDSNGLVSGWCETGRTGDSQVTPSDNQVVDATERISLPKALTPRVETTSEQNIFKTIGTRRTGTPVAANAAATDSTGMSFVEALRELTVRRS